MKGNTKKWITHGVLPITCILVTTNVLLGELVWKQPESDLAYGELDEDSPFYSSGISQDLILSSSDLQVKEIPYEKAKQTFLNQMNSSHVYQLNIDTLQHALLQFQHQEHIHQELLTDQTIHWDSVEQMILNNSKEMQKKVGYVSFTDEEIHIFVCQFREILERIYRIIPNLDLSKIVCTLGSSAVVYSSNMEADPTCSRTNENGMNLFCYSDASGRNFLPFHEQLEKDTDKMILETLMYVCPEVVIQSFPMNDSSAVAITDMYSRSFLGDASMDLLSSYFSEQNTLWNSKKVFLYHNLQLSLLLQPQFQLDAIDKALMLQNPIALLQQFPVLNGTEEAEKTWFLSQYTMLDCYQSEFRDIEKLLQNGLLRENDLLQLEDQRNFADEQLTRNFLWSLMNSTTSRQLTIQDQAYLMKLFQERMYVWNSSMRLVDQLKPYFLLEEEEEWLKEYLQTYQYQKQMKEIYEEYLDTYYDQETFHQIYQTIDLEHMELSDAFTPQEKNFIQELVDELAYQRSTILENQVQKIKTQKVASLQ